MDRPGASDHAGIGAGGIGMGGIGAWDAASDAGAPAHDPSGGRHRLSHLVGMAADFAFETDAQGRFVFVSPDTVLGWPAEALLGQPAACLLADPAERTAFDPFCPGASARGRRVWLRREDGSVACLEFSSDPLMDAAGRVVGTRGVGVDPAVRDVRETGVCAALRRAAVLDHILWRMRQEVSAPRMMQVVLDAALRAVGAQGCAVLDPMRPGVDAVLHRAGPGAPEAVIAALALLRGRGDAARGGFGDDGAENDGLGGDAPRFGRAPGGEGLLVCPTATRFGERAGLALWRAPGASAWDGEERLLASSVTAIVRLVLDHGAIQRELARQSRTDPLTGLADRRAFLDDLTRRIERLDREEVPGTLVLVALDGLKPINERFGHEAGDDVLLRATALLREVVRPADLVGRLGGDEFALWLDGADELTAAERAEQLRLDAPRRLSSGLPDPDAVLTASVGIACRPARGGEEADDVMRRADLALREVKRTGGGHWRVCHGNGVT